MNRSRAFAAIALLLMVSCLPVFAQTPPSEAQLVGWWTFDESDGLAVIDSSGNANHGVMSTPYAAVFPGSPDSTAASPQRIAGRVGKGALRFDRANPAVVRIADSPSLRVPYVTMAAWIRSDGHPGLYNYFWAKGGQDCWGPTFSLNTEGSGGVNMRLTSNGYDGVGGAVEPVAPQLWDGQWHYVVGMYDPTSTRLYIDGELVANSAGLGSPLGHNLTPTSDLFIGAFVGSCLFAASGDIDELKIWNGTFDTPPLGDGPTYILKSLFDTEKLNKSGSTIPMRIEVNDLAGLNVSSDSLRVSVLQLRSNGMSGVPVSSGAANGGGYFRFDHTIGSSGGYIYNLSTKGLETGKYELTVKIGDDDYSYAIPFAIR